MTLNPTLNAIKAIQHCIVSTMTPKERVKVAKKALELLVESVDREMLEEEGFEFCADCQELITEDHDDETVDDCICLGCYQDRQAEQEYWDELAYDYEHR